MSKVEHLNNGRLFNVIRKPIVTEKSTLLSQYNKYTFEVLKNAEKPEIKEAVEKIFKVDVVRVNTIKLPGKKKVFKGRRGQRSDIKKAIVTLKEGHTIDLAAGI